MPPSALLILSLAACSPATPPTTPPTTPPATKPATKPAPADPPSVLPAPAELVAVGDLHGDVPSAIAALQLAGLVDAQGTWIGGAKWLVQTGDTTDRGPDSKGVLALLRRLQSEAAAAGGRVIPLLGNHEVMNVQGDWRYVSPGDLSGYGGEEARRAAFAPGGEDGAWLRSLGATVQVGDTVFAHGGVDPRWAQVGIAAINRQVLLAMELPHAAIKTDPQAAVLGTDGPLWNRALVLEEESVACPQLAQALAALGASRMVVGHTTQQSGQIGARCGGALYAIDTGISDHYGRHLSALRIAQGKITPLHPAP